ncbi:type II toxin-antitoxin system HicA family toxin [Paenibacillus aquistagni]|uniref:type II toxin-antitoxin system HicA family toxin n=1 Tax=Paenibacillus aquistagni TaxID=1852522 RepID=UPI00145BC524|nr:type II toxin-antitoxin system HicA family toxin [Paenibacillus aquistagni]NMM52138.1 type II toxin-antitoxin system HicA family toxin [Paenibacillus aquistagni]
MARIDKLIQKMKNRPNGITFEEIAKVLNYNGYILVRVNGSHHHFRNKSGDLITIPKHHPLKAVYVKDVLDRIGE